MNRFVIPNNVTAKLNRTDLTFEDLVLKQEENIKEIRTLHYQKYVNIGLGSFAILLILSFIPLIRGNRNLKIKLINRIQENPISNGGGVTLANITQQEKSETKTNSSPKSHLLDKIHLNI